MKKLLILLSFISFLDLCSAQNRTIKGIVYDEYKTPLQYVSIKQSNGKTYSFSNANGEFNIDIDSSQQRTIIIWGYGYDSIVKQITDTTTVPLVITLFRNKELTNHEIVGYDTSALKNIRFHNRHLFRFEGGVGFNIALPDFSQYEKQLGHANTKTMNMTTGTMLACFGIKHGNSILTFDFGYCSLDKQRYDSLNVYFTNTYYNLSLKYGILKPSRMQLSPVLSVILNRYRLINSNRTETASLDEYVKNKELDLRFIQFYGFLGMAIDYKMAIPTINELRWKIQVYGGYIFKLHDKPIIYSVEEQITSDSQINIKHVSLGVKVIIF